MEFKKNKSKQNLERLKSIDELSVKLEQKLNIKPPEVLEMRIQNRQDGTKKEEKKNYTLSLSKKTIFELEEFLEDFGEFGETKSSFIQNAIIESIQKRKLLMKEKLLNKIKKLEG